MSVISGKVKVEHKGNSVILEKNEKAVYVLETQELSKKPLLRSSLLK